MQQRLMVACLTGIHYVAARQREPVYSFIDESVRLATDRGGADAFSADRIRMWIAVVRQLDRGAELSFQADHAHRSVRGRRPPRRPPAAARRADAAVGRA